MEVNLFRNRHQVGLLSDTASDLEMSPLPFVRNAKSLLKRNHTLTLKATTDGEPEDLSKRSQEESKLNFISPFLKNES